MPHLTINLAAPSQRGSRARLHDNMVTITTSYILWLGSNACSMLESTPPWVTPANDFFSSSSFLITESLRWGGQPLVYAIEDMHYWINSNNTRYFNTSWRWTNATKCTKKNPYWSTAQKKTSHERLLCINWFLYQQRTVAGLRRPARIPRDELQSELHGLPILLYGIHGNHSPSKILGHAAIQIN